VDRATYHAAFNLADPAAQRWRHSDDALNLSANCEAAQLIIRTRSHLHWETNDAAFVPVVYADLMSRGRI
jgi:hypothetical protein